METLKNTTVETLMSTDVVTVHPQDTAHDALELMVENRVSALPVINGQSTCVGVISVTDIVAVARDVDDELQVVGETNEVSSQWLIGELTQHGMQHRAVRELMSAEVKTISPTTTVAEAAEQMLQAHVHRVPVVDDKQRLLGIFSTMDVLSVLVN